MSQRLTTREVARAISESPIVQGEVFEWQVRRLFEDGTLPEPPKFGGKRVIDVSSLPDIVSAMRHRGWLPQQSGNEISNAVGNTKDSDRIGDTT